MLVWGANLLSVDVLDEAYFWKEQNKLGQNGFSKTFFSFLKFPEHNQESEVERRRLILVCVTSALTVKSESVCQKSNC